MRRELQRQSDLLAKGEFVKLYEIATELDQVMELLSHDGEITPEIESMLATLEVALIEKTDSCAFVVQKLEDNIEAAKKRKKEIDEFIKRQEKSLERFESYIMLIMEKMDKSSIEGLLHKFTIRKPSKVVDVFDESVIPPEFKTVEVVTKVDKMAIKEKLKNDETVMGARLLDGKKTIQVKFKGAKNDN